MSSSLDTPSHESDRAGHFAEQQGGPEPFSAFIPRPLPPEPPLRIDAAQQTLLDRANQALGRLDGVTLLLRDPDSFIYTYVRKEAVLSSQIEGTQSSLSDLLLFERDATPAVALSDVRETSNYVAAMNHGVARVRGGFPVSSRLIREVHEILLRDVRGGQKEPGEFRRSQNWLGGTRPGNARFVPPPAHEVVHAMSDLEKFLHGQPVETPILVRVALAHAQFETIHPFLDGNGRVGRLLVTLLLYAEGVLSKPLLYLSLYLKANRDAYYERLQRVRSHGEWEEWLEFFLTGVLEVTEGATRTTRELVALIERDASRVKSLGRATGSALQVYDLLVDQVILTIPSAASTLPLSEPTIASSLRHLEKLGIVREITGRSRGKVYSYAEYLRVLNEGA